MEKIFQKLSLSSATLVFVILVSIFITLYNAAKPAIDEFGINFITDERWNQEVAIEQVVSTKEQNTQTNVEQQADPILSDTDPILAASDDLMGKENDLLSELDDSVNLQKDTKTVFGGYIAIVGTLLSTAIAMIFALPIAMGIAVFLAEIAPKNISHVVGIAIELLAAIPSIIFGMWGLYYFAPIVADFTGGYQVSLLTAGLVLGVMILPFMAAITRDSMNTTPDVLKESAYALGATKFEVIKDIIFPYSKVGIIGSIILALGRALGETMAVAFLIGSIFSLPQSISDPTVSIPVAMANNFGEASGLGESALFYLALILFIMSFAVISIAKFYFLRRTKQ
ncbi:MAG: phosphate ABC transporter permease subunit PstC [Campylobacterales bacterium]|nr:phosphate ABC transporter permease subunit PstC [Campylobacterales bacterium]